MTEYEQMRKDLARQFRASGGGYKPEPMLDENGKDMLHPMYGKKQSDRCIEANRKAAMGNTWKKGKKIADTSNMKKPDAHKGAGNPRWKGGISLGEKRKEYMANWYNKNKHHYQAGGKYSDRKAA